MARLAERPGLAGKAGRPTSWASEELASCGRHLGAGRRERERERDRREEEGNVVTMREEMAANHQTISITVSGLAELAHSEYQLREKTWNYGWVARWLSVNRQCLTRCCFQAGDYENAEKHSMQLWRQVKNFV